MSSDFYIYKPKGRSQAKPYRVSIPTLNSVGVRDLRENTFKTLDQAMTFRNNVLRSCPNARRYARNHNRKVLFNYNAFVGLNVKPRMDRDTPSYSICIDSDDGKVRTTRSFTFKSLDDLDDSLNRLLKRCRADGLDVRLTPSQRLLIIKEIREFIELDLRDRHLSGAFIRGFINNK